MNAIKEQSNESAATEVTATGIADKSSQGQKNDTHKDIPLKAFNNNSPQSPQEATAYYQPGYYSYPYNAAPNSPPSANLGNGAYDVNVHSLLAQQSAGANPFGGQQHFNNVIPLSPCRDTPNGDANLPPASPLFPGTALPLYSTSSEQLDNGLMHGASMFASTASPTFQYLTGPPPSPVVSYGYPPSIPNTPERNSWTDRNLQHQQHMYNIAPVSSPHNGGQLQYQSNIAQSRRTTSFDGEMLPPPAMDDSPPGAMFSTGGTLLHQQSWAPPPELYSPQSSLQQQQLIQQIASPQRTGIIQGRNPQMNIPAGAHASYFPAATPGPPIQTTQNNKGPDGANLFIFHIPNHFTNLDMWHLFCHYGNLLSVRIMVEKDTGRSRGFGFVSYDSPDAAAMAIKELNGFVIGNKRLKVQHKQIRQSENNPGQLQLDAVSGSQSFQESNVVPPSNGNNTHWTENEIMEQQRPSQPPSIPHVIDESNNASSENAGSKLANLNAIRDALPDVQ